MHDPMVVAHEIPSPIPRRVRWRDCSLEKPTGWTRQRRTNEENLGEPVFPWWRPTGWTLGVGGRAFGLGSMATIWHVEPDGRDAFTVCARTGRWRWHVHHWHVQVGFVQRVHRRLFERCIECGRPYPWGYAPVSHSWDEPAGPWWKVTRRAYHHECSSLVSYRSADSERDEAIRQLVTMARVFADETEDEFIQRFWGNAFGAAGDLDQNAAFRMRRKIWMVMGYEYDDGAGRLVLKVPRVASRG